MILISAQAFPPSLGGIQNLMEGLAEYACARGEAVHVIADGGSAARNWDLHRSPAYRVTRFGGWKPLRRRLKARMVAALAADPGVGAVFADSWKSAELLPRLDCPLIVFAHGNEFPEDTGKMRRIRKALDRASGIIAVSRDTLARMAEAVPPAVRASVIHPPVHPLPEPGEGDVTWARAAWPEGASPRLVSMSRLTPFKGIDLAIRMVASLRHDHPSVALAVCGDGEERDRLRQLAADLGVSDRVRFLGRVDGARKTAVLRAADLLLQPGRNVAGEREGFGITYLEAALAGVPSISGKEGGAPEAVRDGETGLVIDGADEEGATAALAALLDDPDRLARMSAAALAHGRAGLWSNRIDAILETAGL